MILVINLGLKSIRSIIFDFKGNRISLCRELINTSINGNYVEQSADEWQVKFFRVIKKSIKLAGENIKIDYITVTCSSSFLVSVDKDFNPTNPVIVVSDKRASSQAKKIRSLDIVKNSKSLNEVEINSYNQIARILWIKENNKKAYKNTKKFLSPNDYLIGLLLEGETYTDTLNAKKFLYDENNNEYPKKFFSKLDIDTNLLPKCKNIGTNLGKISSKMAKKLLIKNKPEIVLTTYDAITSIFGGGGIVPGVISDQSGTVTSVRMYSKQKYIDKKKRVFCQHYSPTNGYFIGGSNNLGGGLIEWAKDVFYQNNRNIYSLMDLEARNSHNSNLVFLPNLLGSRSPDWNSNERGVFFGIERSHNRSDFIRSIFDSIAFSLRDMVEILKKSKTQPINIIGGGGLSRIPISNEIKSSITGLPYYTTKEFEITALGAAIIILTTNKFYKSNADAAKQMIKKSKVILPDRKSKNFYEDLYGHYRQLKVNMLPSYELLTELSIKNSKKNKSSILNL